MRSRKCEGKINIHRAKASLSENDQRDQDQAESEVATLPELIEQASGTEAVDLRIRLTAARGTLERLEERIAEVAIARREIKRLEAEQQAICAERLVPENFRLEG